VAFDYAAIAAEAKEIIAEFGLTITFNRYTTTSDPVAGTVQPVLQSTQGLAAAVLPASKGTLEAFDVRFMDDLLASQDVRFAIVTAHGSLFEPTPGDEATFMGRTWQVLGCTPLNVNGTPVIFSVGFRRP